MSTAEMSDTSASRRRRGPGVVTVNACTECRKKRSKCDGRKPCARCSNQNTPCVYEILVRQSKEAMRGEIDGLQRHKKQAEHVFEALATGKADGVLRRIRAREPVAEICDWLDNEMKAGGFKTTYASREERDAIRGALSKAEKAIAEGGGDRPVAEGDHRGDPQQDTDLHDVTMGDEIGQNDEPNQQLERPLMGPLHPNLSGPSTVPTARSAARTEILGISYGLEHLENDDSAIPPSWTNVTSHISVVEHLMALYFCWEYPTFASLSKDHFLGDFRSRLPRYCSPLLVNAMLSLGCRFSSIPEAKGDPENPTTSGDHFFTEAKRLLALEKRMTKLTTIQAAALMCIREASCGRDTESFYYCGLTIRLAVEAGLHQEDRTTDEAEREVRRATFWGAFNLDQACSLNVSKIPHISYAASLPPKPSIISASESSLWFPYTDEGAQSQRAAHQPSNVHSIYRSFSELSELIHDGLYTLYSPRDELRSQGLVEIYTKYLKWYGQLPDALRLGYNFTPAVLFSHLYYHFAILSLFRPFIKLSLSNSKVSPHQICLQAADAITILLRSYDQLYTLARTPSLVPYIVFAALIIHLTAGQKDDAENKARIRQGVEDLKAMQICHPFAVKALHIVKYLSMEWGILDLLHEDGVERTEKDEAAPPAIIGWRTDSTNLFVPRSGHLWKSRDDQDILFNVFPLQGLPLLSSGAKLEQNGFVYLVRDAQSI